MKLKTLAAALVLAAAGPAAMAATCNSTGSLGDLTPPDLTSFTQNFGSAIGNYADCRSFTISTPADALGFVVDWDRANNRNFDVTGVSVYQGGIAFGATSGLLQDSDTTPEGVLVEGFSNAGFSLGPLGAGIWTLVVESQVTGEFCRFLCGSLGMGYTATVGTVHATVPEPGSLALLGVGLVGAAVARRRKQA